jgi:hypothetical protein
MRNLAFSIALGNVAIATMRLRLRLLPTSSYGQIAQILSAEANLLLGSSCKQKVSSGAPNTTCLLIA